jgi:hypothetical protein
MANIKIQLMLHLTFRAMVLSWAMAELASPLLTYPSEH